MGLDFQGSNVSMSYGSFMQFRRAIAKEAGIDLDDMEGFREGGFYWRTVKDPIKYFLNHSDCDGSITSRRCGLIAPRLKELGARLTDDWYREMALELADDMQKLSETGQALEFC